MSSESSDIEKKPLCKDCSKIKAIVDCHFCNKPLCFKCRRFYYNYRRFGNKSNELCRDCLTHFIVTLKEY